MQPRSLAASQPRSLAASQPRSLAAGASLASLLLIGEPPAVRGQGCNLDGCPAPARPGCTPSTHCPGGGDDAIAIVHASVNPCRGGGYPGGSFDLTGTQYEGLCISGDALCGTGCLPSTPFPLFPTTLRLWQFNDTATSGYLVGNHGCQDQFCTQSIVNGGLDLLTDPTCLLPVGFWLLWQANWFGPEMDGSPSNLRTVAEMSDLDLNGEGTKFHLSWYLTASVDVTAGYDFDRVKGADRNGGCGPADPNATTVPSLTVVGRTLPCINSSTPTLGSTNQADSNFFDVSVSFTEPTPAFFTEAGIADPMNRLIEGYEVLAATLTEPTTSAHDPFSPSTWTPVGDPAAPSQALGTLRYGTRQATVALPKAGGASFWLATRVIYSDCGLNGSESAHPGCTPNGMWGSSSSPRLGSKVSSHCGPVKGP